jgi:CheY-like chemotaxis protein
MKNLEKGEVTSVAEAASARTPDRVDLPQRILVVDDNGDSRQLSVDVLAAAGYKVEAVKDGAAGWDAFQYLDYDLILTDNKMPKMTGLEMIEKMYATRLSPPVIMATRHLPMDEFARRPWLKPDATLQRPFTNDELLAAVKKILHATVGAGGQIAPPPRKPPASGLRPW